ncbi:hypothetical protein [Vagococcus teuberi]|nr:hypothetical protein [Vagococcus teuberi]
MNKVNYLLLLEQGFELVDTLNEESCDFATTHHISGVTGKKQILLITI